MSKEKRDFDAHEIKASEWRRSSHPKDNVTLIIPREFKNLKNDILKLRDTNNDAWKAIYNKLNKIRNIEDKAVEGLSDAEAAARKKLVSDAGEMILAAIESTKVYRRGFS